MWPYLQSQSMHVEGGCGAKQKVLEQYDPRASADEACALVLTCEYGVPESMCSLKHHGDSITLVVDMAMC